MIANNQGFYINLPCGGVTAVLLLFFFSAPTQNTAHTGFIEKVKGLDLPGFLLFVPAVIMLLLALQWGGDAYPWKSATVIGLICGFVCTISCFALWQWHEQDEASIPPAVFTQRSVFFGAIIASLAMGGLQLTTYYLPIWFQVIKDSTPTKSGIMYFPSVLGDLVFSVSAGLLGELSVLLIALQRLLKSFLQSPSLDTIIPGYYLEQP